MIKNYVIDTNVMVHDPNFLNNFEDNNIIIPIICIEELDGLKKREGLVGYHARQALREIDKLRGPNKQLNKGVQLENNGSLRIELNYQDLDDFPEGIDRTLNDNKILAVAKNLGDLNKEQPTILVTKDLIMAIKADSMNIPVEDYKTDKIEVDRFYKGYSETELNTQQINQIFENGLDLPEDFKNGFENHFYHVKNIEDYHNETIARVKNGKLIPLKYLNKVAWGLKPINREQKMAFELLMDPEVHLVTITGGAGSGKTILSTAIALQKVIEEQVFRKIIFVRPVVPAGNDIGYLPGSEEEKLKPWMGPFYDAIDSLFENKENKAETVDSFIDMFRRKGMIETKTFNYMRGRTLTDALVIIDEAQQTTPHLAKLMLTRAGEGSKFIFIGDVSDNQIDSIFVDSRSNGLVYIVEKMKDFSITGHIELHQVERSPLAKLAEKNL